MITAVDTSVLLDVFGADPRFGPASKRALRQALAEGAVRACEVVWADLGAAFLIGAHARTSCDRLLTRDRGFFRGYFDDLVILQPG